MNKHLIESIMISVVVFVFHFDCFSDEATAFQTTDDLNIALSEMANLLRPRFQTIVFSDTPVTNNEERAEQFALMTNVFRSVSMSSWFDENDLVAGIEMINWVMALPSIKSDKLAIEYCANGIFDVCPVSTNAYLRELVLAHDKDMKLKGIVPRSPGTVVMGRYWGPNLKAVNGKWRPIFEYNRNCNELRLRAIRDFLRKFPHETNLISRIKTSGLRSKPQDFHVRMRMKDE